MREEKQAIIRIEHLNKQYIVDKKPVDVLKDISLEIKEGEFVTIVGHSGCGKSTLLRLIAGLEKPSEGTLRFDGEDVSTLEPMKRNVAMVFQSFALYPHLTVYKNMAFPLKSLKLPQEEIKRRVEEAARILDITHLLDRRPKALSGGQKQRVALGRAIVRNPQVFLLDEPLSNLDAKLRAAMRTELTKIHQRLGTTFVYVTHDQVEAMTMATRIVVMKDGLIQQVDTPQNLYDKPVNLFVAGFIGTPQMNFLNATLEQSGSDVYLVIGSSRIKLPAEKANDSEVKNYIGKEVIAGIRPECISDDALAVQNNPECVIEASVDVTELMGAQIYLYLNFEEQNIIASVSARSAARAGDTVKVAIDASRIHLFDKDTERYIIH